MKSTKELIEQALERFEKLCTGELVGPKVICDQSYDSHWEQDFQWQLQKNLPDWFTLRNQVPFGPYRADFVFTDIRDNRQWIVEFDGKAYHDLERDGKRDSNIMRFHPEVQAIVRVDASTGHYEYIDARGVLSRIIPECFNMRLGFHHDWSHQDGVFTARAFDCDNHDWDDWTIDGELREDAPHRELRISIISRGSYETYGFNPREEDHYF